MKIKRVILLFIVVLFVTLICLDLYILGLLLFISFVSLYLLNRYEKIKITDFKREKCIDFMSDKRRNFDLIKIGLPFVSDSENERKLVLDITSQNQSIFATYLFLIHNFSYLSEDSGSQIEIKLNRDSRIRISLSEISCFHIVTLKSLGIKNLYLLENFPIIYYIFPLKVNYNIFEEDIKNKIDKFCVERKINFKFI